MILPQTAFAQMNVDVSHGDVTIDNTHVTYHDSNGKQVRAAHQGAVAVTQSDAKNTGDIVVTAAKPVSITLDRQGQKHLHQRRRCGNGGRQGKGCQRRQRC